MSRIFDPFFTTKDIGKGTGLGLSVVHGIVEAHRGVITVRSQPGEGTTFEAFFPVTAEITEVKTEMFQPLPKGHGENILLVDDDPAVLPITRMMLEKLGYQVESSPDPHAALKLFTAAPQRFALVITDYAMPGLDGVELSERLWNVREKIPVILYSGYGGQFTPDDAARLGFAQMLEKPFQPRALAEAVAAALRTGKG
jgi:CheY-like chemotaxis protein